MKKRLTLIFAATALFCIPVFSQVYTTDLVVDSLEGFDLGVALQQSGESHHPHEAENQIRIAKRDYIDKKYSLGKYAPGFNDHYRIASNNAIQTACSNVDFELGDFSSWSGAIGDNTVSNAGPLQNISPGFFSVGNDAPITNSLARHTLITPAFGNDPYGNFPGVPPGGGNYTVRMGGETPNYQGETMEQTFTVSPTSTSFAYQYAAVLNDPQSGHVFNAKPYFKIEVLDQNGNPISPCTQYFVVADASLSGFTLSTVSPPTGGVVYYRPWTTVNFDLSTYVNQNITVRFTVAGCTQSGHFGYAYFDCSCSALAATANFCPGNTTVYLTAPDGYSAYQWLDTAMAFIPGATNDTLLINNPVVGQTYYVYLTSASDTSCHNILPINLQYTQIQANATSSNPTCNGYNDGSATALGTVGWAPYTYQWQTLPPQNTQTITNLPPGTYVVHMTDSLGCETYDTTVVVETPRLDTTQFVYSYCQGNPNMIITVPAGYADYSWTNMSGNPLPDSTNQITVLNPVPGSYYNVVLTPPPGCPMYDSVVIPALTFSTIYPNPTSTATTCFDYTDGSVTATGSNGIAPYTYTWNTSPPQTGATVNNLSAGTYIVHMLDSLGCEAFDTIVVTEPPPLDTAIFNYRYCLGNPNLYLTVPAGFANYVWQDANGDTITNNVSGNNIIISNPQSGTHYTVTFMPPPGCPIYDSIVLPTPLVFTQITSTASATNVPCFGYETGTVSATGNLGVTPYTYTWNSSMSGQALSNLPAGTYSVNVVDAYGCTSTNTVVITEPPRIDTSLMVYTFCPGDPNILVTAPAGFSNYVWIGPNGDTLQGNGNSITVTGPQIGQEYSVILENPPACPIYDSILLNITPPSFFFTPGATTNVFTPNGDLKNDRFYPYWDPNISSQTSTGGQPEYDFAMLYLKSFEIWVYDRWGNEVFYSNDYSQAWDGTVKKGKDCTDGVYFWICKMTSRCSLNEAPIENKGFVHLVR